VLLGVASLWGPACGRVGYDQIPKQARSSGGAGSGGADVGTTGGGISSDASGGRSGTGGAGAPSDASVFPSGGTAGRASGGGSGTGGSVADSGALDSGCGRPACDPWWDPAFTRRRKLSFAQDLEPENVSDLSVLVRLDATRISYGQTQPLGQDIRFVDDDGTTVLPHEIERWGPASTSVLWVRVPRIDGGTNIDHIWMYYGNAVAQAVEQKSVVWSGYDAVYHLDDFADSTGKQPVAVDHGTANVTDGIGHARLLDGVAAYIDLGSNLSLLEGAAAVTLSARVRVKSVVGERALFSYSVNSAVPTGLSRAFMSFVNAADVRAGGRAHDTDAASSFLTTMGGPMKVGSTTWTHLAAVIDLRTQEVLLFADGSLLSTDTLSTPFTAATMDKTPTSFNVLGASDDATSQFLDGALDEVRITSIRRSASYIGTDARSEDDTLIQFGAEEVF
jgi:biopolymer transport protein ExbB